VSFAVGSEVSVRGRRRGMACCGGHGQGQEDLKIRVRDKVVLMQPSLCHPMDTDAPDGGVDDMTKLAYLHEPGVLANLTSAVPPG